MASRESLFPATPPAKEAQLPRTEKNEAIFRLAAALALDVNNSLAAVLGHCEALSARVGPASSLRVDIDAIRKTCADAAALTRRVLALHRPPAVPLSGKVRTILDK